MINTLTSFISKKITPWMPNTTRIHPIKNYIKTNSPVYVKREDELSSGIVGSKWRKYTSILHFLIEEAYANVIVIGGENSNNVIGITQLLIENNIKVTPFLLQKNNKELVGNSLWLRLLCPEQNIHWIERQNWTRIKEIAENHRQKCPNKTFLLPEGGNCWEALPGAMTLTLDIIHNEKQQNIFFDNIFIDSGTGITSIAMILAFAIINQQTKRSFFITLLAGTKQEYHQNLQKYTYLLQKNTPFQVNTNSLQISFLTPPTAASFGSVNQKILTEVKEIAHTEGILVDPIYSAKHFLATQQYLQTNQSMCNNNLIIYNGGSLGLAGFQNKLRKLFP